MNKQTQTHTRAATDPLHNKTHAHPRTQTHTHVNTHGYTQMHVVYADAIVYSPSEYAHTCMLDDPWIEYLTCPDRSLGLY